MSHEIPPSLVPVKQSKSLVKALRGIPHFGRLGFSFTLQEEHGEPSLVSQRARSLLGTTTAELSEVGRAESMLSRRSSVLQRSRFMEMLHNE